MKKSFTTPRPEAVPHGAQQPPFGFRYRCKVRPPGGLSSPVFSFPAHPTTPLQPPVGFRVCPNLPFLYIHTRRRPWPQGRPPLEGDAPVILDLAAAAQRAIQTGYLFAVRILYSTLFIITLFSVQTHVPYPLFLLQNQFFISHPEPCNNLFYTLFSPLF